MAFSFGGRERLQSGRADVTGSRADCPRGTGSTGLRQWQEGAPRCRRCGGRGMPRKVEWWGGAARA